MTDQPNSQNRTRFSFAAWAGFSTIALFLFQTQGLFDLGTIVFFFTLIVGLLVCVKIPLGLSCLTIASIMIRTYYAYHLYSYGVVSFPDTIGYFRIIHGMLEAESLSFSAITSYASTLHVGYHYVAIFALKMFKTDLSLYMLNVFLFFLSVILLHDYVWNEFGKGVATAMTIFMNLSGFLFVFTSDVLKDSLVLFLTVLAVWTYGRYKRTGRNWYVIPLLVTLSYLTLSRIYSGIGLVVGIVVDFLVHREVKVNVKRLLSLVGSMGAIFLFTPLRGYLDLGISFMARIEISMGTMLTLGQALFSFFFSPLFWNMTREVTVYTPLVLDSIFFLVFSPLLLKFLLRSFRYKEWRQKTYIYVWPILFHVLALGVTYGTGGERQRISVYPFIFLLYLLGLVRTTKTSKGT